MSIIYERGQVWNCYLFARRMRGNHNPNMIMGRSEWEIFRDDFRGKLGEVALKNYINRNVPNSIFTGDIDFTVTPRGQWDITDLIVNGRYINVKSVKGGSNFLMIETSRYDKNGNYSYNNNNGQNVRVDMYALVKVDIDKEMDEDDMDYQNISEFWNSKGGRHINSTLMGAIAHDDFWRRKHIAPQHMMCGIQNLNNVCRNQPVTMATPQQILDPRMKTRILQQENYILDGRRELLPIENLL